MHKMAQMAVLQELEMVVMVEKMRKKVVNHPHPVELEVVVVV